MDDPRAQPSAASYNICAYSPDEHSDSILTTFSQRCTESRQPHFVRRDLSENVRLSMRRPQGNCASTSTAISGRAFCLVFQQYFPLPLLPADLFMPLSPSPASTATYANMLRANVSSIDFLPQNLKHCAKLSRTLLAASFNWFMRTCPTTSGPGCLDSAAAVALSDFGLLLAV